MSFRALVVRFDSEKRQQVHSIERLTTDDLPEGEILIAVEYSSLNYKDGLAVTGKGKVIRSFPLVPGIDLAGTVLEAPATTGFAVGDRVVLTGWGVGERFWGGYAQKARVQAKWLVRLPETLSTRGAMAIGTAGLTAMLCVMALEEAGCTPEACGDCPVLVTGAGGGVGSIAASILAHRGYKVAALSGRSDALKDYFSSLGVSEVIDRKDFLGDRPPRVLESQRWAAAVDTVGGAVLSRLLPCVRYGGAVAACGLAGGPELNTTVMPFILRNVSLLGVDSVMCPAERREKAWKSLVEFLPADAIDSLSQEVPLCEVPEKAEEIIAGKVKGRLIVNPNAGWDDQTRAQNFENARMGKRILCSGE